jgi:hypothetical protein
VSDPVLPIDFGLRRAVQGGRPAPADARARVRARLEAAIPGMVPGIVAPPLATGPAGPAIRSAGSLMAAFLVGGVTGAVLLAALERRPLQPVVDVGRAVTAPAIAMPPPPVGAPVEPDVVAAEPALPTAPPVAHPKAIKSVERPAPAPRVSAFAAERVLLDEARAAIVQGAPDQALDRLEQHRSRFPNGLLSEERDAMAIEALVDAGRYAEARSQADAFRARTPGSLFLATVDSAIASIPSGP